MLIQTYHAIPATPKSSHFQIKLNMFEDMEAQNTFPDNSNRKHSSVAPNSPARMMRSMRRFVDRIYQRRQEDDFGRVFVDGKSRINAPIPNQYLPHRSRRPSEEPLLSKARPVVSIVPETPGPTPAPNDTSLERDPETEEALIRCYALAAAVTTWCFLQPFILFSVVAHFRKCVRSFYCTLDTRVDI